MLKVLSFDAMPSDAMYWQETHIVQPFVRVLLAGWFVFGSIRSFVRACVSALGLCFCSACMRIVLLGVGWARTRTGQSWKASIYMAQGILLKHKFYIEWHLNNNNRPSIIFTTLLCRAYRFLFRMNHAIDKLCWWIFAVSHTIAIDFIDIKFPQHSSLSMGCGRYDMCAGGVKYVECCAIHETAKPSRTLPNQLAEWANNHTKCVANNGTHSFYSNGSQPTNKRYKMKVKIVSLQQCQMESVC